MGPLLGSECVFASIGAHLDAILREYLSMERALIFSRVGPFTRPLVKTRAFLKVVLAGVFKVVK